MFCFWYFSLFIRIHSLFMGEKLLTQGIRTLCRSSLKSKENKGIFLSPISFFCHPFLYQGIFPQIEPCILLIYIWKELKEPPLYYSVAKWNTTTRYIYEELSWPILWSSQKLKWSNYSKNVDATQPHYSARPPMVLSQQLFVRILSRGSQVRVLYGGLPPLAQLVEHRNTTQQHRKSKTAAMSEMVKEWDLSSHGGFHRVGSSPAGSI